MQLDITDKKVAVFGAGAIGCWFASLLARRGIDVVLIGRKRDVDQIQARGLRVETGGTDTQVLVWAETDPAACGDADVVLICVKSPANDSAVRALRDVLRPDAIVVSMQNGVENVQILEAGLGRQVLAAAVYVACERVGPGHVRHHGRCDVIISQGDSSQPSRSHLVQRVLAHAGVAIVIADDVRVPLWEKLILNCAYNALSAISARTIADMVQIPEAISTMRALIAECVAVARADGVAVHQDVEQQLSRITATIPSKQLASMYADLRDGKPTEVDQLNGLIVRRAQGLGIEAPVNRAVLSLVKLLERDQVPRQLAGDANSFEVLGERGR